MFPPDMQSGMRELLAGVLEGVVVQFLIPHASAARSVLATEILVVNYAARALIRDGDYGKLYSTIMSTGSKAGMHTLNQSLTDLTRQGFITHQTAMMYASRPDEVGKIIK